MGEVEELAGRGGRREKWGEVQDLMRCGYGKCVTDRGCWTDSVRMFFFLKKAVSQKHHWKSSIFKLGPPNYFTPTEPSSHSLALPLGSLSKPSDLARV